MKKIVLTLVALIVCSAVFAKFKDSCTLIHYTHIIRGQFQEHEMRVSVEFYSGYEMNLKNSTDEHLDNSVIAVIQFDTLDYWTVYIKDVRVDTKFLTKEELKKELAKFSTSNGQLYDLLADDKHGGHCELVLE
jgi:hypothetical protein